MAITRRGFFRLIVAAPIAATIPWRPVPLDGPAAFGINVAQVDSILKEVYAPIIHDELMRGPLFARVLLNESGPGWRSATEAEMNGWVRDLERGVMFAEPGDDT